MISFAGIDLSPPGPESNDAAAWWHAHRVAELEYQGYFVPQVQHLPTPYIPEREPPRIGVLTWPTGADKFAKCHLVCTGVQAAAIRATVGDAPTARVLVFDDGAGGIVSPGMYFLALRPISQRGDDAEFYLLSLVDERYFWWQTGDAATPTSADTWDSLFTQLYDSVGAAPAVDTPAAAYLTPNPLRWFIGIQPPPLVAEAAALTVGLRTVRACDGTVTLQSYATALAEDALRWDALRYEVLAGGRVAIDDICRSMPERCDVCFFDDTTTSIVLSSLSFSTVAGVAGRAGRVTADPATVTDAQRAAYADQAARDYYLWGFAQTDATFRGFVSPEGPCGLDALIEWVHTPTAMVTRILRPVWSDRNLYGEPAPSLIATTPVSGSGSGSGSSAWSPDGPYILAFPPQNIAVEAIRDTVCILGIRYTTRGRLVPFINASVIGLSWYLLETRPDGCCPCPSTGSSNTGATACCPYGTQASVDVAITGPFGSNCEQIGFGGTANRSGDDFEGTATGAGAVGAGYTAVAKMSCVGGQWRFDAVITRPDGSMVQVGFPVYYSTESDLFVGSEIYNRLECGTGNNSVGAVIGNPCLPLSSGSDSSGSGGTITIPCCPNPLPTTIYVDFGGGLAGVGTNIPCYWTGVNWTSSARTACGATAAVVVLCTGLSAFSVSFGASYSMGSATTNSCSPLSVSTTGTALGTCSGAATANVHE